MIDQTTLITYLAILLGFVFIPGPAVLLTLARASTTGTRAGFATALGIAAGDLVHTALAVAISAGGVGAFLRRNPIVLRWQGKVVGGIYCALGVRLALQEKRRGAS